MKIRVTLYTFLQDSQRYLNYVAFTVVFVPLADLLLGIPLFDIYFVLLHYVARPETHVNRKTSVKRAQKVNRGWLQHICIL